MPPLSARPLFSKIALSRYFQHISLPSRYAVPPSLSAVRESSHEGLSYLYALQKYQQATVPFANLYLHYSRHHVSTLNPYELYEYIVNGGGIAREGGFSSDVAGMGWYGQGHIVDTRGQGYPPGGKVGLRGGRGGSCTLNNGFFGTIMRSLGYDVRSSGARVAKAVNGGPKAVFGGWDHMVNIVTVEGKGYLVDVGFNGNGPTEPVLLEHGHELQWGVTEDKVRVIYQRLPQHTDPDSRVWVLQHKKCGTEEWDDIYAFMPEVEFLPEDFEVMNFRTTRWAKSWFNQEILCVKTLLEGEDDGVAGVIMLTGGKIKRRVRGENHNLDDCKTEAERVEALKKYFGIVLSEEEKQGINGMVTQLNG